MLFDGVGSGIETGARPVVRIGGAESNVAIAPRGAGDREPYPYREELEAWLAAPGP